MKIDQDNENPMSGWIVLAGCIVSLLGVLAMSRFCDIREKDMVSKLKEAEAKNEVLQIESDMCCKGFREELKKVIRFRCPDNKEAK